VAVADDPVGHEAAVAAAHHAETLFIDITFLYNGVYTGQDVVGVFFGPLAAHRQGEVASIADAAARVGVEYNIAIGRQRVHFMDKTVAILRIWSAVNLDDQGVFARRVEVGRLEYPAVHRPAIRARVGDMFGSGNLQFVEQVIIERGQ